MAVNVVTPLTSAAKVNAASQTRHVAKEDCVLRRERYCSNQCCSKDEVCCESNLCCAKLEICCKDLGCAKETTCCAGKVCGAPDDFCSNGTCCLKGEKCCGGRLDCLMSFLSTFTSRIKIILIQEFVALAMNTVAKDGRMARVQVVSKMKVAVMAFVASTARVFVALTADPTPTSSYVVL
jgi:hypothetical protein